MQSTSACNPRVKIRAEIALLCAATFLVFFRARWGMTIYGFDDRCYVEWLFRFLDTPYSSACLAPGVVFPGTAVMWMPAGLIGLGLSKLFYSDPNAWIPPCVGLCSFLFWCLSLRLVHKLMSRFGFVSPLKAYFVFLSIPVLFYSTRRTTMSHSAEFLLCLGVLDSVLERRYYLAFALSALTGLTRINDVPIFLLLFGQFLDDSQKLSWGNAKVRWLVLGSVLLCLPFGYIAFIHGYGGVTRLHEVLSHITLPEWERTLTNGYYGLLWSGNIWLVVFLAGVSVFPQLSFKSRLGLIWMFLMLLVCVGWTGGGGCIFSRYLIGTYAAGLLVGLEVYQKASLRLRRIFFLSLGGTVLYVLYLSWMGNTRFPLFWSAARSPELEMGFILKEHVRSLILWGLSPLPATIGSLAVQMGRPIAGFPAQMVLTPPQLFLMIPATLTAVIFLFLSSFRLVRSHRKKERGTKRQAAPSPELVPSRNPSELLGVSRLGQS